MPRLSNKKAKRIAGKLARAAVKQAGVTTKKGKATRKATRAALKPIKKGKKKKARKAARRVARKAA